MILNHHQAEAVYTAMVALNNVSARAHVRFDNEDGTVTHAVEYETGEVQVFVGNVLGFSPFSPDSDVRLEAYSSQHTFAKAYKINN